VEKVGKEGGKGEGRLLELWNMGMVQEGLKGEEHALPCNKTRFMSWGTTGHSKIQSGLKVTRERFEETADHHPPMSENWKRHQRLI